MNSSSHVRLLHSSGQHPGEASQARPGGRRRGPGIPGRGRTGLATRLTRTFVLVAGALLLAVGLVLTYVSYNAQLQQVQLRQQKTANEAALVTTAYLSQAQDTLETYGQLGSLQGLLLRSMEIQQEELSRIMNQYGEMFQSLTLLDAQGDELARVSRSYTYLSEELTSRAGSSPFETAIAGDSYIADRAYTSPHNSFPAIVVAVPMRGRDRDGVLIADVSVKGMWDAIAQVEVGETGYAYIINRDTGEVISHSDLSRYLSLEGQTLEEVPLVRQVMTHAKDPDQHYVGLEGERVVGAAADLAGTAWTMVVELPTDEALSGVRRMIYLLGLLTVLGAVIAGSLGLAIPRRVVQPILALQVGAQEIGAGHLDHAIEIDTGDELEDLADSFNQMAASLQRSRLQLERWGRELEERVDERTAELGLATERMRRRANQLQISAKVAHAIASVHDLDGLLPQVTHLISERFGWYHVGIFLLDDSSRYAVLHAANSTGGQRLLEKGHRLKVGEAYSGGPDGEASEVPNREPVGIVGRVAMSGEPRIALDVGADAVYFDNPELPHTRSEMALPLMIGGGSANADRSPAGRRVIGVLDVQSVESAAYDEEDVALLSTLADQVAVAIQNARLFEQTQEALQEVQTIHRQYVRREWARSMAVEGDLAYEYRREGMLPLPEGEVTPEMRIALAEGRLVTVPEPASEEGGTGHSRLEPQRPVQAALAAPIKLRDQVIGALDLHETEVPREWTADEIVLVQAIADQVGVALENARLFADTQRRAEQLATLHRVGLDVTGALDLDGVLEALYQQIRRIMDTGSFYVALYDKAMGMIEFPLITGDEGRIDAAPRDVKREPGITGYVLQAGEPVYVRDLARSDPSRPYDTINIGERSTRSYIGVPLVFREQVFGVLSVQSYRPTAYTKDDVALLSTIATQASIAIQNARAYQRLVETAEQLREIDRLKTQFLANMSHELRTPLNSIIGFSRVMLKGIDGPLTDLQEADLSSIYSSGQHLLSLINSILDMSKIEAGKMDLSFGEVSLHDIFGAVLSTTRALVKDEPIELRTEIPDQLPTVWADNQRVRQILINLLSNAAKFTEEGHITLRAEAGPDQVTISVEDTGVGMDEDSQRRLFIPFQQVDSSTTRRAGGTGLGLAISRSFVDMHGGQLWVESEPRRGSTFFFTLPTHRSACVVPESDDDVVLEPGRKVVLAVDDDRGVITLLKRYLEHEGYRVVGVVESPQAVDVARKLAPHLAAITLDIVMPRMDGWQVLQALRQEALTKDVPVILCSIVEGLEQGLEMGADLCLRKPVTRDEVLDALERVEQGGTRGERYSWPDRQGRE